LVTPLLMNEIIVTGTVYTRGREETSNNFRETDRLNLSRNLFDTYYEDVSMNRGVLVFSSCMFFFSVFAAAAVTEESKRFNNLGMGMYEQKNYIAAAESFLRSIETDPANFLAHYNLACTLTLLRQEHVPRVFRLEKCASFDIDLETIFNHLQKAADLNEHRKTRMLEDPDLLAVRSTLRFHQIAGRSLPRDGDARIILPAVIWRVDYQSAFRKNGLFPDGVVRFSADGRFRLELWKNKETITGTYSVSSGRLVFKYSRQSGTVQEVSAVLSEKGAVISGLAEEPLIMWNDTSE
jgi:tetratricopeptide (TPR) repeat protein